jgi:Cd2+/Zn2+-exporting ATPase
MARIGAACPVIDAAGTLVHVAANGVYAGCIVTADQIKPGAKEALASLKQSGVHRLVMLTGDSESSANRVAGMLGIREYHSQLLPGDKVTRVEALLQELRNGNKLAFVGDGINDAPVLSRADIGIAMGAMGSDAAIEAADVVLMDDDPMQIAKAIRISKKCIGIVKQNTVFALIIKFGCLALSMFGIANMWFAIFADVGVMILAVLNAMRVFKIKK